mmetsp:Transcript_48144/g.113625  ORF Transcript_48144/g.113625 Transcript_48144/m.113625 type:complete len:253 (-) Transcript_48144:120-878(-)
MMRGEARKEVKDGSFMRCVLSLHRRRTFMSNALMCLGNSGLLEMCLLDALLERVLHSWLRLRIHVVHKRVLDKGRGVLAACQICDGGREHLVVELLEVALVLVSLVVSCHPLDLELLLRLFDLVVLLQAAHLLLLLGQLLLRLGECVMHRVLVRRLHGMLGHNTLPLLSNGGGSLLGLNGLSLDGLPLRLVQHLAFERMLLPSQLHEILVIRFPLLLRGDMPRALRCARRNYTLGLIFGCQRVKEAPLHRSL